MSSAAPSDRPGPCNLRVLWDDRLISYDFGPTHPLNPVRVELTMALAREYGVLDQSGVEVTGFEPAGEVLLELIHDPSYIAAVRYAGSTGMPQLRHGLGTADNPVFIGMHEASTLVAGASVAAAEAVWTGRAQHAANIAGGLHHAMRSAASGFCVYDDPALAIAWLLENGAERVAYVDVDVHHGDGVQAAFYDDPRVLTISLHETPRTLFPGTGFPEEIGTGEAKGTAVNVALPPGTGDAAWLRAFHAVVPPLLRAFRPQVLLTQHGCDTHVLDPLAHLTLTVDGQRAAYAALHKLAHETAGGRWIITGGGGYELVQVVPRAWTHLLAEASGRPLEAGTDTPEAWRDFTRRRTGQTAPRRMTDVPPERAGETEGWEESAWGNGYDPSDPVDQAIRATRKAVFPEHGLDPLGEP
ncbi:MULTISPECIES: acetoin utilization protein AcuC [Thermomonospora]|uniref:Acetoin utilization protein AcuC n=1 Tax=Thermomonospora curvata (strain ATCC 19995 / DSM 43183 / JCM 3096 / KCTC 9072 / NBRC 15933 / NCIMB 10081 / Henssen B9) TaxID=471852 RepID=D1A4A5_THECD|nr:MULTISPECIES: acetoin utilization protein AcuC [Thermomonospora]ACY99979.1 Histone deacetylase [Thermomonospora curvata DSM 43183]PKK12200.1 MAG: acetoin utilization protein AcuC [Thermomonospora sp. CIF 1]